MERVRDGEVITARHFRQDAHHRLLPPTSISNDNAATFEAAGKAGADFAVHEEVPAASKEANGPRGVG